MPFSVDLKPCSDCGEGANCDLRVFYANVLASIAAFDEKGEEISVYVPKGVILTKRVEKICDGFLRKSKEVFKCAHESDTGEKGSLTIVCRAGAN